MYSILSERNTLEAGSYKKKRIRTLAILTMLSNVLHLQVGLSWSERCPPLTNSDATAATTQSALARHCRKKRRYAKQLAPRKKEIGKEEIQWDFFYFLHFLSRLSL